MIECEGYRLSDPEGLETPAMLVFEEMLDHNIRTVCDLAGGGENLMVHVKTHKSAQVARKQLEAGVAGFKCATLKELEMVLQVGAEEAILAYPMAQRRKVERFADLSAAHGEARVCAVVSAREHLALLEETAGDREQPLKVMVDLDAGMHRTGIAPGEEAGELYRRIAEHPHLVPAGLHLYDGHDHFSDPAEREAAAQRHIQEVREFQARLEEAGLPVPCVVGGGSFSFAYYARTEGMRGSPGTNVYWDMGYGRAMPDLPFKWAALILTQVIDRYPEQRTITTDLGYKAICGDLPLKDRAGLIGHEEAELALQNEEHGIFRWPGEPPPVGTYLLAVPGHACPTTIRYPGSYLVDGEGRVIDFYPHTARDRQ